MKTFFLIAVSCVLGIMTWQLRSVPSENLYIFNPKVRTVNKSDLSIRLLIIKHSRIQMANDDANLAISAANKASAKGLDIKVVGNDFADNLEDISRLVSTHIDDQKTAGDTLIVHTIGHGLANGSLQNIGQRTGVSSVLVENAEKHNQSILWWQLSCYASAKLPDMVNGLFNILASSTATETSATGVQGRIMEKLFGALAEEKVDENGDGEISSAELSKFLDSDGSRRGRLLYSKSPNESIFSGWSPIFLPIRDHNRPQRDYPRDFVPIPHRVRHNSHDPK